MAKGTGIEPGDTEYGRPYKLFLIMFEAFHLDRITEQMGFNNNLSRQQTYVRL